jgi:hypothetical protein
MLGSWRFLFRTIRNLQSAIRNARWTIRNPQSAIRNASFAALLLGGGLALALTTELGVDTTEQNRWLLSQLRRSRGRHEQLLRDARAFNDLPVAEQTRIRELDLAVRRETSATQVQLLRAAERYADWLDHLPAAERQQILAEPDKDRRLALIRQIRQRQWVDRLPPPQRDQVEKARGTDQTNALSYFRDQERHWRHEWRTARRGWDEINTRGLPDRLEKLPEEVQTFVKESLFPRLRPEEHQRLRNAEGRWPLYPHTLVELTDSERVAFRLLSPTKGPSKLEDLPPELQKRLKAVIKPGEFKKRFTKEGRWPEYAVMVSESARRHNIPIPPLGPSAPRDFPKPTREYIQQKMMAKDSVLDEGERGRLRQAEGLWPFYPHTLLEVAHKHNLQIPGVSLPGSIEFWDIYRDRPLIPDERSMVSDRVLSVFAQFELTPAERAEFDLSLADPIARDRLQQEYIKRHPEAWQAIVDSDRQKRMKGK